MPAADVLLLTAPFGGGHLHACIALEQAFKRSFPEIKVVSLDFFKEISPWLAESANSLYLAAVRFKPEIYGYYYDYANRLPHNSSLQKGLNQIGLSKAIKFLNDIRPQVVVSFYPTPSQVLGDLKAKGQFKGQLVTVVTDYALNKQWFHPQTDLYLVAASEVKNELTACGVPSDKINVTGIPISLGYSREKSKTGLLQENGLEQNLPLLMICSGAFGLNRGIEEFCKEVAAIQYPMQTAVLTGKNYRLKRRLDTLVHSAYHPFHVYGYVKDMSEWMEMADLIVSKSGGLTVSEALASELPMIIFPPFPGQETSNALYMQSHGAAVVCKDISSIPNIALQLLKNPLEMEKMRCAAREIKKPLAANHAAKAVTEMLPGIHAKKQA